MATYDYNLPHNLPPSEADIAFDFWPVKIVTPETIVFEADRDYKQYDICFPGAFCGMIEYSVSTEQNASADIHEGMEVMTTHLGATENTFNTLYTEVWVDPLTFLCYDTYGVGRYGVGMLVGAKDANGSIRFKKRRYYITEPVTPAT
jgi:hypothetical protein